MGDLICLSVPNFCGNERKYVDEAIDTEWVSTAGQFIGQFEEKMAVELDVASLCLSVRFSRSSPLPAAFWDWAGRSGPCSYTHVHCNNQRRDVPVCGTCIF